MTTKIKNPTRRVFPASLDPHRPLWCIAFSHFSMTGQKNPEGAAERPPLDIFCFYQAVYQGT